MVIENLDEIVKYLDEKKDTEEVQGFLKNLTPKEELNLDKFLEKARSNEEIDKYLKSQRDKAVNQGLETYKGKYKDRQGSLETIVETELNALRKKLAPEETEQQKELRELKAQYAADKAQAEREKMKNYLFKKFNETQLPISLIDELRIADNEESANAMIETIGKTWNEQLEKRVEDRLKSNVRDPQKSNIPMVDDESKLSDFEYFTKKGIIGK